MRNRLFLTVMSIAMILFFASCGTMTKTTQNAKVDMHTSQNSLDWSGVYQGVLPCADCEGIQTTVQLKDNGEYKLGTEYLGTKEKYTSEDSGKFTWDDAGQIITLDNGDKYFVGENQLTRLDQEGQKVTGRLASYYILQKANGSLTETYWKLLTLNGEKVEMDSTFQREPHLILKEKDHRVSGNAGCNQVMGTYSLHSGNKITFSQMATTLMACPNLKAERAFLKMLEQVNGYTLNGEELSLENGDETIATFKAVYFH